MPSNQGVRLHDDQETLPVHESGQRHEHEPRRIVSPTRLHLPFDVQRQLLPEEQVLRRELGSRPQRERRQPQKVVCNAEESSNGQTRPGPDHASGWYAMPWCKDRFEA